MKKTQNRRSAAAFTTTLAFLGSAAIAVAALPAQKISNSAGSGSLQYFSESRTSAGGGSGGSATYALTGTFGRVSTGAANSPTYTLAGGFAATLKATSAAPWLTAAQPTFITPRSRDVVWLSGSRLFSPTVSVSGRAASVIAQSATDVAVRMPNLSEPGWHEIRLRNATGETTLERGIGVLPLVYTDRGAAPNLPFEIVFQGTNGDMVIWALGLSRGPLLRFGPYLHGLTMGGAQVRVMPSLMINSQDGERRLAIPASPYPSPFYVQGLFLSTNPGYAPGSFSNVLEF